VCYILTLPLLFLTPLHPFTHLSMRLLINRTVLLSSLTSPIPYPLTPLMSSLALLLNLLTSSSCYALGSILPITLLSSTPTVLIEILQSPSLQLVPTRLILIPWSTLPFVMNTFALLTTLIVVIGWLNSYLVILSFHLHGSPVDPFLLFLLYFSYI